MKFKHVVAVFGLLSATPLLAQTAPVEVKVGATVYDQQGGEVGKVEKVEGGAAVVNTGKNTAALPTSGFGKNAKGLLLSMTREQLDAAVEAASAKAQAAVDQALVTGAALRSSDGQPMGTVKAISADGVVTIDKDGKVFSLKKDAFTTDAQGLALKATAAQINEALATQAAPAPAAPATPPAKGPAR